MHQCLLPRAGIASYWWILQIRQWVCGLPSTRSGRSAWEGVVFYSWDSASSHITETWYIHIFACVISECVNCRANVRSKIHLMWFKLSLMLAAGACFQMSDSEDVEGPLTAGSLLARQRSSQRRERRSSPLWLTARWVQLSPDAWTHSYGSERFCLLYVGFSFDRGDKREQEPRWWSIVYSGLQCPYHSEGYLKGLMNPAHLGSLTTWSDWEILWISWCSFCFQRLGDWIRFLSWSMCESHSLGCGRIKDVTTQKIMICSQKTVELNLVNRLWRAGREDGFMCTCQPVTAALLCLLNDSWFTVHTKTSW